MSQMQSSEVKGRAFRGTYQSVEEPDVGKNILEVTAVTTTLYLATINAWFTFTVFTGVFQIEQCLERQRDLEKRFAVDAVCVTRFNDFIMVKEEGNNVQENSLCGSGVC